MELSALLELLKDERFYLCLTSLVAFCSALSALTPSPKDDAFAAKLYKLVDLVGMNWGHAKNAKPEDKADDK